VVVLAGGQQIEESWFGSPILVSVAHAVDFENGAGGSALVDAIEGLESLRIDDRLVRTVRIAVEHNAVVPLRSYGRERIRLQHRGQVRSLAANIGQSQHHAV